MQLYIYSALSEPARQLLLSQLPSYLKPIFRTDLDPQQQQVAFQQAEVVLGNPPPAWFEGAAAPAALQFWQIDSAGIERYQEVSVPCPVANMGDYFAWPCAETIVAGILGWYRHIPELARLHAEGTWVGAPIRAKLGLLGGKRVVILGRGTIGRAVAEQLSGFRCEVQFLARTSPEAELHSREDLLAALPTTDIVVNCLPGSAEGLFSADLVAAMPAGSLYASIGRGNTTDENALLQALQAGQVGGAVLDVTAQEPLPPAHPFWQMPQVLLTQHSGGGQPYEDEGKVELLLRNLSHLRQQEPPENLVDLARGY